MRHAAVLLLLLAACGEPEGVASGDRIKAGRIEFKYSGQWRGTGVLHFDDYGDVVALRENMANHPEKDTVRSLIIWKAGQSILCDFESSRKQAYASTMRVQATELGAKPVGERKGSETIAGRKCDVYESDATKVWLHGDICLKFVDKKAGHTKEATKFEELDAVPASEFELPEGFKLR